MRVNKTEFARIIGKTITQIDYYVARGMPGFTKAPRAGEAASIELEAAIQWLLGHAQGALDAARTRESEERAEKLRLEVRKLRGELLDRELVATTWAKLVGNFRSRMLAVPTRLAGRLRGIDEPNIIREKLEAEIHAALSELSEAGEFRHRRSRGADAARGGAAAAADGEHVGGPEPATES